MSKKVLFLFLILILSTQSAMAEVPITVVNPSFELPGTVKQHCWDAERPEGGVYADVPGWTDGPATSNDSGVETGYTPTDGTWTAFMMAGDPNVYNITDFLIGSGDIFQLQIDSRNTWASTNLKFSLFYDDNGTRVKLASNNVAVTDTMQTFSLTIAADTIPTCYNHKIGIELDNSTTASASWIGCDNVRLTLTSPLYRAQNPSPAHEGVMEGTSGTLTWTPGHDAVGVNNYHVYFSDVLDDVNNGASAADKGLTTTTNYDITDLVPGVMYYWRIDTVIGANTYTGNIWSFTVVPLTAYNPDPDTGSSHVSVEPVLTWTAGSAAVEGHVVFFGEDFDSVNNAPVGISGSAPFMEYLSNPDDTDWSPVEAGLELETSKTYYWRIDEVESTTPMTIYQGEVWSFTTVPIAGLGSITREVWENITGTDITDLTGNPNYPDNPSFTDYLPLFDTPRDWADNYGTRVHGWLYIETTGNYTFWFSTDDAGELWLDGNLIASNTAAIAFHQWDASAQSSPINLEAGNLYYIMALQKEDTGRDTLAVAWSTSPDDTTAVIIPGTNLLPFEMYVRVLASIPRPGNGVVDVPRDSILTWISGNYADTHNVYFGTVEENVAAATPDNPLGVLVGPNQRTNNYDPGILNFNTTYYWRVDEVNDLNPDSPWIGTVWSFTVGNFVVVEDFEDYNDYPPNEIWATWIDGYGDATNGSSAGYPNPDFVAGEHYMETSIVHGGSQSMPIFYDNSAGLSEVTKTLTSMRNWTQDDVVTLSLWYYGDAANAVVPMYVALNGNAVVTNPNANAVRVTEWTRLDIPLQDFASKGVNLSNVNSISIGFGNKAAPVVGGSGYVFIDDIRLYR